MAQKIDDFDKNALRRKVHSFWLKRQIPTLNKILTAVNDDDSLPNFKRTSLYKILKSLNFKYVKKSLNSALLEREDIVNWRQKYLDRMMQE